MSYDFNATEVDTSKLNDFDALPAGRYPCTVDSAELRDTKAGDGKIFVVCYSVAKGDMENRKIFVNYNIENPNPKAQDIGRAQLAQALTAVGHPQCDLANPEVIYDKIVYLKLAVKKRTDNGEVENVVRKYLSLAEVRVDGNGQVPTAAAQVHKPVKAADDIPF